METIFAKGGVGHQMYFVEGASSLADTDVLSSSSTPFLSRSHATAAGRWLLYSTDTGLKNWLKISGMENEMSLGSELQRFFLAAGLTTSLS